MAVTYGADGFAAGVTASASGSRGKADGVDVTQRNSHLSAGNTATLISGNDTTLKGAVLSANTVVADIGGDLNIESVQDTSTYASKDKAVGGSVTFGVGFSASASYSSNKVNGDFASVTEQSGIQAGDGGFDIRVHGNTDLKGGVIASTQAAVDAGVNRLQTGTLTVSDITNTNNYKATGISLSGGYAAGGSKDGAKTETQTPPTTNNGSNWSWQNQGSGAQGAAAGYSSKSGSETSLTTSGISGGTVVITDQAGQQAKTGQSVSDVLAALNRDVLTGDSANGLVKGWDGQKLQRQVSAGAEITATFGQQASKAVGDYASKKALVLRAQGDSEEAAKWDEGGEYRIAAHTAMGLLGGGVEGALGSAAAATAAPVVSELTKNLPKGVKEAVGAGLAAGLGAAIGGSAGAATAFNEDANNRMLHPDEVKWIRENAAEFAKVQGIGEKEAYNILLVEAAAYVEKDIQDKLSLLGAGYENEAAIAFLATNRAVYGSVESFDNRHRNDASMFANELGRSTGDFVDVFNALADAGGSKDDWHLALAPANTAFANASSSQWGVFKLQVASAGAGALAAAGVITYPTLSWWAQTGLKSGVQSAAIYTLTTAAKANSERLDTGKNFTETFANNFSWPKLGVAATVGAAGGVYTQQMLTWAGLPIGFLPSVQSIGGIVIRGNQMAQGTAISKAANAAVDHYKDKDAEDSNP
ncbi:filamentous hemagglutinin [Xanthomonas bromi]|uniref:Filamentous hemagglutinin n=1 Tax=Xanthomonas bromi TaxID=56449 RepID=A0A1C3NS16_9XANT|nr:filamentous hemagglutinin [Xanthomonas bromi]